MLFHVPNPDNKPEGVGTNDVTVSNNIVYDWGYGFEISRYFVPGGSGHTGWKNVKFLNNQFQSTKSGVMNIQKITKNSQTTWQGNQYNGGDQSKWFNVADVTTSFSTWKANIEPTATIVQKNYEKRTLGYYNQSIGGTNSTDEFILRARKQSKDNWDPRITAEAANAYIKAGFFNK